MKRSFIVIISVFIVQTSFGQYNPTIRSARPGKAFGPFTTGKNIFQIQTGITFDNYNQKGSDVSGNGSGYLMSLRYGLEEAFEIRAAFATRSDITISNGNETRIGGLSAVITGLRYNIRNGKGQKASYAIQTDVRLNIVDEDYDMNDIAPRIIILHGQNLGNKLGLITNWGLSWNGDDSTPRGTYVIRLPYHISKKFATFIETYGDVIKDDFRIYFDTGLSYLVNNDFQLDISAGYGSNNSILNSFIDAGISWRTGKWKQPVEK